MKKKLVFILNLFILNLIFAKSLQNNEVYVKGSNINMKHYIQFCDETKSIKNLYVQKYEVTRKEFEEYLDYFGYNKLKKYSKDGGLFTYNNMMPYSDCAAVLITFYDACKYCNWRSMQEGYEPAYEIQGELSFEINYFQWKQENGEWSYYIPKMPEIRLNEKANGYRLPTINEYFYLLLGGQEGIDNKWWELIDITEFEDSERHSIKKVGSYKPNPLGLYDILSNASEWLWHENLLYAREDSINYSKNAIGITITKDNKANFNLKKYFNEKKKLSLVSPLERWFIGMRMVRNAE
ncbi:MAG: SUMF1/EgtB/PvdO family nonheme iron enzyme [Spirochaetales bacterium]|nr:SUMF1/EgtB/PvdO family nonheme iron enzyme [Spirochaetales bacterium]